MSIFLAEENSIFQGNYSQPFGLGYECELIQRAAKAQIIKYLPEITAYLQKIWDERDKELSSILDIAYNKLQIQQVSEDHIWGGIECVSMINSPVDMWPSILVYSRDASPYGYQEDHFDTSSLPLKIEILCAEGPIKNENIHNKEGLEAMQILDSKMQRLSDAVYLCIQKDKSLSGTIGQIEKPSKVTTSEPWARKEEGETTTGDSYIFQGKQFDFTIQKITI